jgi:hypothetical protein
MFPIIVSIFVVVVLIKTFARYRNGNVALSRLSFWTLLWLGVVLLSWRPDVAESVTRWLGVREPINLMFAVSILFLFYAVFSIFVRIELMRREITRLVRELAQRDADDKTDNKDNDS